MEITKSDSKGSIILRWHTDRYSSCDEIHEEELDEYDLRDLICFINKNNPGIIRDTIGEDRTENNTELQHEDNSS